MGFRYHVNNIRVTSSLPAVGLERNEAPDDLSCPLYMRTSTGRAACRRALGFSFRAVTLRNRLDRTIADGSLSNRSRPNDVEN